MSSKKIAFTLLELMIVIIIIGILATLAIPRFIDAAAKARLGAAQEMLGSIRSSQLRYNLEHGAYTSDMDALDVDMTESPDWTVDSPGGTADELGKVTNTKISPNEVYTISENGVVSKQ